MDITEKAQNAFETIEAMTAQFFALVPQIIIALIVFIIFWFIAKILSGFLTRLFAKQTNAGVGKALGRIAYIAMLFVAFLLAVAIITPSVGAAQLLQVLGVGSVAIGFAFKDILQNFLAGLLILLRQPFTEGDWIKFDGYEGVVKSISTRSTWLRTFNGHDISIPNGEIFTNPVSVVTRDPDVRSQYDIGISYDADIDLAKQIALDVVADIEQIYSDPKPDIGVDDLGDSAVVLRLRWWTKTSDMYGTKQFVLERIKKAYDQADIGIPYPHRTLEFTESPLKASMSINKL